MSFLVPGRKASSATWSFRDLPPGRYRVSATWVATPATTSDASFQVILDPSSTTSISINQRVPPGSFVERGARWEDLGGPYQVVNGALTVTLAGPGRDGAAVADAVRIERLDDNAPLVIVPDDDQDPRFAAPGWMSYDSQTPARYMTPSNRASGDATWTFTNLPKGRYRLQVASPYFAHGWNIGTNFPGYLFNQVSNNYVVRADEKFSYHPWYVFPTSASIDPFPFELGEAFPVTNGKVSVTLLKWVGVYPNRLGVFAFPIATPIALVRVGDLPGVRIIDNRDAGFFAPGWFTNGKLPDSYLGGDTSFRHSSESAATATWTFTNLTPGTYRVSTTWVSDSNRASNAVFTMRTGDTVRTAAVNQRLAPSDLTTGATRGWKDLSTDLVVTNGTLEVRTTNAGTDGYVIADAVRVELLPTGTVQTMDNGDDGFAGPMCSTFVNVRDAVDGDLCLVDSGGLPAVWRFVGLEPGRYRVAATWVPFLRQSSNTPFSVTTRAGTVATPVNQEVNPSSFTADGRNWHYLGTTFTVTANAGESRGFLEVRLNGPKNTSRFSTADAIRIERVS